MDCVKKLICLLASLCTAVAACSGIDPIAEKRWRTVGPRLGDAPWGECCIPQGDIRTSCSESDAPRLLEEAHGDCLDTIVRVLERRGSEDLAAAYFLRAQREGRSVDFLQALHAAEAELEKNPASRTALYNKGLIEERLGLVDEAMTSWNRAAANDDSAWGADATSRRQRLSMLLEQRKRWRNDLENALRRRDRTELARITAPSPSAVMRHFEESGLFDSEPARLLASVLTETGDHYAQAVLDAIAQTKDRDALEQGIREFQRARALEDADTAENVEDVYERAAVLLERAGNPLSLSARFGAAAIRFSKAEPSLPLLDSIRVPSDYRDLSARVHTLRANALEYLDRYLEAHGAYDTAFEFARGDDSATAAVRLRRSANYTWLGDHEPAFREALAALALLPNVPRAKDQYRVYATAAQAAEAFGDFSVASRYRSAALAAVSRPPLLRKYLTSALRQRADTLAALGDLDGARTDLEQARDLAEAVANHEQRELLLMRIREVGGQILLDKDPRGAVAQFTAAMALADAQDSTHRVILRQKRAMAFRKAGDYRAADEDIREALRILHQEAEGLLVGRKRGKFESLWTHYFSRFEAMQRDLIASRIAANDVEGSFVLSEQTRAFEPLHLLLQTQPAPPEFHRIETVDSLRQNRARIPDDTVILQYLVLQERTYVWVLTRERVTLVSLPIERADIERWVHEAHDAIEGGQWPRFDGAMRAAYELVRAPLSAAPVLPRLVIVPDGPMHGIPFAALEDDDVRLIDRASIAVAGSTSLYLYALLRDRQFASDPEPSVLLVGNPTIHPRFGLAPLPAAQAEARELGALYEGAETLLDDDATPRRFLAAAQDATIIHFAGHAIAKPATPWLSMLVLAPDGADDGDLTAQELLTEVTDLAKTRLIVLAACSTASGRSVGPEGVAPLVRPLVAARVPAVVGTLWDVRDATVKDLLVSLHCHYRNGDDVAVALQKAQREMLRKHEPAGTWAPFQVVGYAASPYPRPAALEETRSEHIPCQNSFHRPHGLRSQ